MRFYEKSSRSLFRLPALRIYFSASAREFSSHFSIIFILFSFLFSLSHARLPMMFLARIRKVFALLSATRSPSSERSQLTTPTPPLPITMSEGTLTIGTRGLAWTHPQRPIQRPPRRVSSLSPGLMRRRRFDRRFVSSNLRRGIRHRRRRRSTNRCRAPYVLSLLLAATDSGVI